MEKGQGETSSPPALGVAAHNMRMNSMDPYLAANQALWDTWTPYHDLPQHLTGQFDVVFTSHGVLGWLPDLAGWAQVIAHFLKPGGIFYIVEVHPLHSSSTNGATMRSSAYASRTSVALSHCAKRSRGHMPHPMPRCGVFPTAGCTVWRIFLGRCYVLGCV